MRRLARYGAASAVDPALAGDRPLHRIDPFRCRMWDLHDRLHDLIDEESCRTEIASFQRHGQLVPVLGRPITGDPNHDVELIFGARRLFVARHLNVPLLVELRTLSDRDAIVAMDIENRQRRDISPYERGLSFASILRSGHFKSQDELALTLEISQSKVSRLLMLARLPAAIVGAFESPLDIREIWGPALTRGLGDAQNRGAMLAKARLLASATVRPSAVDIYHILITASAGRSTQRNRRLDEVVKDATGKPRFRIRVQKRAVVLLLPIADTSAQTLENVRAAVLMALSKN